MTTTYRPGQNLPTEIASAIENASTDALNRIADEWGYDLITYTRPDCVRAVCSWASDALDDGQPASMVLYVIRDACRATGAA